MAWQTPKVNWVHSAGVRTTDLNRIEANLAYLKSVVEAILIFAT